jgi:hypothetical protein
MHGLESPFFGFREALSGNDISPTVRSGKNDLSRERNMRGKDQL